MRSAKTWIPRARPLWMHGKRMLLVMVLGLFASVHLLAASPSDKNYADTSLASANWASAADAALTVIVENGESSVSMDVILRDASSCMEETGRSRLLSATKKSGLRRFSETGTTGPPSIPNNNSVNA